MSIFLGSSGLVRLERTSANKVRTSISAGDVSTAKKRFTLSLPADVLQTGDRLYIRRIENSGGLSTSNLTFIAASAWPGGSQQPDGSWYIHVDSLNGIRLYSTWAAALKGAEADALSLASIASGYPLVVSVDDTTDHVVGGLRNYELTTNREAIDVTSLGDAFVRQYEGLISGEGSLECLWDIQTGRTDTAAGQAAEYSQYLHQLVLRQKIGSRFRASLFLKQSNDPGAYGTMDSASRNLALFYGIEAVVTQVAISFESDSVTASRINFVTTGAIELLYEQPANFLRLVQNSNNDPLVTQQGSFLAVTP
jgi:hypothetical protein